MADPFVLVPVPDPMIGTVIDRFIVVGLLARGGMGSVYVAQHEGAPQIKCVIKTMLAHLAKNAMAIERFKSETKAVTRVKHENVVRVENFGVLPDGQLFMRFEFIEGKPLDRYLAEHGGRLSLQRAAYLTFQVCDALDHAHALGVVHRDLKPDNLLIVTDFAARVPQLVKIVDFGISKVVSAGEVHTGSGVSMGTPYYMAVEQYANAADAGPGSDIYSLAVIIWLMLTGELPWGRPDPQVLYHLQRTVIPTRPPEDIMPAAVADILLRCFSVRPDDRPTMRELALLLASVIPATDRTPSGTEILKNLVPRWFVSAPEDAQTAPHPMAGTPGVAAQLWPQVGTDAAAARVLQPLNVVTASSLAASPGQGAPAESLKGNLPATQRQPQLATAHERPRAAAKPDVPAGDVLQVAPAVSSPTQLAASSGRNQATTSSERTAIASLPTGLESQIFAAPRAMVDMREPSRAMAAEIPLADGTPGPQPFAHAELPSVLVSTTQLSGLTSEDREPCEPPLHPAEPPPMLVLPREYRPRGRIRRLVWAGAALVAFMSIGVIWWLVLRGRPHAPDIAAPAVASDSSTAARAESSTHNVSVRIPGAPATTTPPSETSVHGESVDASPAGANSVAESAPATGNGSTEPAPRGNADNLTARGAGGAATVEAHGAPPPPAAAATDTSSRVAPIDVHRPSATRVEQLQPAATGKKTGELVVLVKPWAMVWVNGKSVDQTPYRETVPVGRYLVRIKNEDLGKEETKMVTVTADQTTIVERKW